MTITVTLTVIVIVQSVYVIANNHNLTKSYSYNNKAYNYEDKIINGKIDINDIRYIFPSIITPYKMTYLNEIKSACIINYYQHLNDNVPIHTINKGECLIVLDEEHLMLATMYGLDSFPTNVKGWRLVKPFTIKNSGAVIDKLLYVKMNELQKVCNTWLQINPHIITTTKTDMIKIKPFGSVKIFL
jgi:hypothetical protein